MVMVKMGQEVSRIGFCPTGQLKKHQEKLFPFTIDICTSSNIYLFGGQVTQRFVAEDLKSWNLMTRSVRFSFQILLQIHSYQVSAIANVLALKIV